MHNDIPEAQRQQVTAPQRQSSPRLSPILGIGGLGLGILLVGAGWFVFGRGTIPIGANGPGNPVDALSSSDLFGHRPYKEAQEEELVTLQYSLGVRLQESAAIAFEEMARDASYDGINLVALSGFRTKEEQNALFFEVKKERNQVASKRAEVSAPPGYSEHHTGFAVDIGDADSPETHVEVEFSETVAFEWLARNAARYSFELSFPEENEQGVSYEPWHWRFVGNQTSLELFHQGS